MYDNLYPVPEGNVTFSRIIVLSRFDMIHFGMGYVKLHGFHGNPLYDYHEWGGGRPTNPIISRVLLILEH